MLAKERQNIIVETVNKEGSVVVKELSEKFDVTEDSIRKDLSLLEKKGLLKKTYGGAVKNRVNTHELYVSQRKGKNIPKKQAIAKKAFKLIEEGDVIFLDISTVNIELIRLIVEANLKIAVVTNMIDVMMSFTAPSDTKLIFVGGTLNRGRDGFVGAITNKQIAEFRFDKAFMGVVGVELEHNKVYTYAVDDALTKKVIMESSNASYMMLENRKFSKDGNYRFSNVDDFTGVILDEKPETDIIEKLGKYNLEIY
ncbi:MAG: DeoR/GlpR family DNA-binding transcription regulator [Eubacterium sp.]